MFLYDKDMERVMLAKKKEVLNEIEAAKKRVLEELYCLKRSAHSDLCNVQADYNRIVTMLADTANTVKKEVATYVANYQKMIAETFNSYNSTIDNKLLELEAFENSMVVEVQNKLAELEAIQTTVTELTERAEQIISDGVTQNDLTTLRTELVELINSIDVTDELNELAEQLRAEMPAPQVQADWNESDETSPAFVKNRTHYLLYTDHVALFSPLLRETNGTAQTYSQTISTDKIDVTKNVYRIYITFNNEVIRDYGYVRVDYSILDTAAKDTKPLLATFEDESSRFELRGSWYAGNRWIWFLEGEYNFPFAGRPTLHIGNYTMRTKTLDPNYLANNALPGQYLRAGMNDCMEWTSDLIVASPNGTLYKISVSDDGTLSAVVAT